MGEAAFARNRQVRAGERSGEILFLQTGVR
jgi:hypothetical protein